MLNEFFLGVKKLSKKTKRLTITPKTKQTKDGEIKNLVWEFLKMSILVSICIEMTKINLNTLYGSQKASYFCYSGNIEWFLQQT